MPRIAPRVLRQAVRIGRHHRLLLPTCRDLQSTTNELRWMKSHAVETSKRVGSSDHRPILETFVLRRAQGEPLQYILGSEYFGDLEIKCRPGVLIPRQDTAAAVTFLATLLRQDHELQAARKSLRVLDLCTGTGCIPLLFHHEFYSGEQNQQTTLELVGVDVSAHALSLARENLILQIAQQGGWPEVGVMRRRSLQNIGFVQADVLAQATHDGCSTPLIEALQRLQPDDNSKPAFDVLISNPPYISPQEFRLTTSRSVRRFEPKCALVPPTEQGSNDIDIGDHFYPRLLQIGQQLHVHVMLFEVSDMAQARRVAARVIQQGLWSVVEIWRDEPGAASEQMETTMIGDKEVVIRGVGHGRSVFARRK